MDPNAATGYELFIAILDSLERNEWDAFPYVTSENSFPYIEKCHFKWKCVISYFIESGGYIMFYCKKLIGMLLFFIRGRDIKCYNILYFLIHLQQFSRNLFNFLVRLCILDKFLHTLVITLASRKTFKLIIFDLMNCVMFK